MANPWAGEVRLVLDGQAHELRLTLGALAELEADLAGETVLDLIERFEAGKFSTRDVLALIVAGLRGGGWRGVGTDLLSAEIEGGLLECTKVAAQLLARAFTPQGT
ncbi:gene transfer agent family protein [uncultured Litoreibacter sp.]|uniref:gene transfer agent family protein n=1 Tax=uncultured Litoreibacter sp. TaxID=1392394 RepID=UPI002623D6DF|nr:gene transfer agent family protein [uncultured Litoreibacter sp.]